MQDGDIDSFLQLQIRHVATQAFYNSLWKQTQVVSPPVISCYFAQQWVTKTA